MIVNPPVDKLEKKIGNKYALSVVTYKRAKQIDQGARPLVEVSQGEKSISIAANEIMQDKIKSSEE